VINFSEKDGAIFFSVKVVPRSSQSEIVGELDGALKVKLKSPPVEGAANAELVKLLSKTFSVSKSEIEIAGGQASKLKLIKISNLKSENFLRVLQAKI
jgi:uncharacterized protein (TIGR00251 family)